ncbi:sortase family protein [Lacticaseibacillus sp. GG6-2]
MKKGLLAIAIGLVWLGLRPVQPVAAAPKIITTSLTTKVDVPVNLASVKTTYATSAIRLIQIVGTQPVLAAPQKQVITVKVTAKDGTTAQKQLTLNVVANSKLKQRANMIYFRQSAVPYIRGGTWVKTAPALTAQTWGGNPVFSGTDKQNTHFIGHNPGVFVQNKLLRVGDVIKVTDAKNRAFTYHVYSTAVVNALGYTASGADLYSDIASRGTTERIVLQSSVNAQQKLVVFAR